MKRRVVATIIGLFGVLFLSTVWVAGVLLCGLGGTDDCLPVAAVFLMTLVVLVINPVLARLVPRLVLDRKQLTIIFGVLLVGSVTMSQGLLTPLVFPIATSTVNACEDPAKAELYEKMAPPASLFPDKLSYGE